MKDNGERISEVDLVVNTVKTWLGGGCRARAYGYFRDVAGPDPGCSKNQKYWSKITNEN